MMVVTKVAVMDEMWDHEMERRKAGRWAVKMVFWKAATKAALTAEPMVVTKVSRKALKMVVSSVESWVEP